MPGVSGLEATRRLLDEAPETRVLVLTVSADETDVTEAIVAGACGYVLKDRPGAGGDRGHSRRRHRRIALLRAAGDAAAAAPPRAVGSGRAVVRLQLDASRAGARRARGGGQDRHEIAATLGITLGEMRSHAASILAKLQARAARAGGPAASDKRRA